MKRSDGDGPRLSWALPAYGVLLLTGLLLSACAPATGSVTTQSIANGMAPSSPSPVVESRIVGNFRGFNFGNVYVLDNGQAWQQVETFNRAWLALYPAAEVYAADGVYRLRVAWMDRAVEVRRIR